MENKINLAIHSSTGIVRERNEDAVFVNMKNHLLGVCDGMGGLKYGKDAAEIVSEYFQQNGLIDEFLAQNSQMKEEQIIQELIYDINQRIAFHNYSWYVRYGCTLCGIWIVNDKEAIIFNLGDSRCYFFKNDSVEGEILTRDHNRAAELKIGNNNKTSPDNKNGKNILTKYIGNLGENEPCIYRVAFQKGDRFLICTDGLYNELQKTEIDTIIYNNTHRDIGEVGSLLVDKSIAAGGRDNVTVLLIEFVE